MTELYFRGFNGTGKNITDEVILFRLCCLQDSIQHGDWQCISHYCNGVHRWNKKMTK